MLELLCAARGGAAQATSMPALSFSRACLLYRGIHIYGAASCRRYAERP